MNLIEQKKEKQSLRRNSKRKEIYLLIGLWSLFFLFPLYSFGQDNKNCYSCHADSSLTGSAPDGKEKSVFVSEEIYSNTVHGSLSCVECHTDLNKVKDFPHNAPLQKVNCGTCHDDVAKEYGQSIHAFARSEGNRKTPTCASCHGEHNIFSSTDERSSTNRFNLPKTCAACHSQYNIKLDPDIKMARTYENYMHSVHGQKLSEGNKIVATCIDCHGVHDLKGPGDINSKINRANIPKTCSQCHKTIFEEYTMSIHGKSHEAGITDSPICTDCHGEHVILSPSNRESFTSRINLSQGVCARCHEDSRIIEKYGLPSDVGKTYQDSYHGLATKSGSTIAATCVSCHNSHYILPKSNPSSTVNPNQVASTCMRCHEKADAKFAASYSHSIMNPKKNPINRYVSSGYIVLIIFLIGGMVAHNALILYCYMRYKFRQKQGQEMIDRFDTHIIIQHILVTLAFIMLVVTGFALKFPDAWWVKILASIGLDEVLRGILHRIFAVLLIISGFYHILYLIFSRKGKAEFHEIFPRYRDITDLTKTIKFHLGKRQMPPPYGKYDYSEKAEYWALIWGFIIMGCTGIILWFPTSFAKYLPYWAINVVELIHYYEAWLATLAIIVWHFFFVIFHPREYPMNFSWLTGKIAAEEARKHYTLWYRKLIKKTDESKK